MRGGPRPAILGDSEAALKRLVAAENQLSLAEYRDRLAEETGIRVHAWTLGRTFRRLGLTRKKENLARGRVGHERDRAGAPELA